MQQTLGVLGQGEEERHTRGDTRTLQTTYVSQSDPGFLLTTRRESCACSLDCTLLSGHLWSLAMSIPPSSQVTWACPWHAITSNWRGKSNLFPTPQYPKGWNFAWNIFFSQVPVQPCAIVPSPAADPMVHFIPSSFQSSSTGQNSSFTHAVASHDRQWIYYKVSSKTDSRSSLQDGTVPHRHEGSTCTQCCLTGRRSPALEPYSYNQVYIPWPFQVLDFTPSTAASIIIFLETTFQSFLSLSNKSLGPTSTTVSVPHNCPHSPLTLHLFSHLLALTEAVICLRNSVRHTQLFTAPGHLVPTVFKLLPAPNFVYAALSLLLACTEQGSFS